MDTCTADLDQQRPASPNGGIASPLPSLCTDEAGLVVKDRASAAEVSNKCVALPGRFVAGFEERCDTGNARSGISPHDTARREILGWSITGCSRIREPGPSTQVRRGADHDDRYSRLVMSHVILLRTRHRWPQIRAQGSRCCLEEVAIAMIDAHHWSGRFRAAPPHPVRDIHHTGQAGLDCCEFRESLPQSPADHWPSLRSDMVSPHQDSASRALASPSFHRSRRTGCVALLSHYAKRAWTRLIVTGTKA